MGLIIALAKAAVLAHLILGATATPAHPKWVRDDTNSTDPSLSKRDKAVSGAIKVVYCGPDTTHCFGKPEACMLKSTAFSIVAIYTETCDDGTVKTELDSSACHIKSEVTDALTDWSSDDKKFTCNVDLVETIFTNNHGKKKGLNVKFNDGPYIPLNAPKSNSNSGPEEDDICKKSSCVNDPKANGISNWDNLGKNLC